MTAICSGPGGGKTRFLDEVSDLFCDPKKRDILGSNMDDLQMELLNGLVPISITYSGTSPFNSLYDSANANKNAAPPGFALRILFQ